MSSLEKLAVATFATVAVALVGCSSDALPEGAPSVDTDTLDPSAKRLPPRLRPPVGMSPGTLDPEIDPDTLPPITCGDKCAPIKNGCACPIPGGITSTTGMICPGGFKPTCFITKCYCYPY